MFLEVFAPRVQAFSLTGDSLRPRHFRAARQACHIPKTSSAAPRSPFSLTGDGFRSHHPSIAELPQQRRLPRERGRCRACEADEVHELARIHLLNMIYTTVPLHDLSIARARGRCRGCGADEVQGVAGLRCLCLLDKQAHERTGERLITSNKASALVHKIKTDFASFADLLVP